MLIYISKVIDKVAKTSSLVISLSFINNLGFIASSSLVKEIVKALKKVAQTVLEWSILNVVTYITSKTKAIFFSKSHQQWLNKQLQKIKIKVDNKKFMFNKEAIRWLGIWLDSQLNLLLM